MDKVFNDPIHGSIQMPGYCQIFIDTPEFQGLRFIKQLGCICYVFPSAVHTRFEHSIGVSHLGGKLVNILRQHEGSDAIDKREVACVEIACLCRNLGYGPFSHAFEVIGKSDTDNTKWKEHEELSVELLKYLIDKNGLKKELMVKHNICETELSFIYQLIQGVKKGEEMLRENKFYLYQIVNNSVNGVDVNTWDYVARDAYYLGMKCTFDVNRILPFVKVFDVKRGDKTRRELCFRDKVESDLKDMFVTKRRLHDSSDQHRVSKTITNMLKNAFELAADHLVFVGKDQEKFKLLESVEDPEAFCQVNDTIVNEIMRSISQEPRMVKARRIIERIHKRELYQCIEVCWHAEKRMGTADPDEIEQGIDETRKPLLSSYEDEIQRADNIEVEVPHFDYTRKDDANLAKIRYYDKLSKPVPKDQVPADLPQRQRDVTYCIYSKLPVANVDRDKTINEARKILEAKSSSNGAEAPSSSKIGSDSIGSNDGSAENPDLK